MLGACQHQQLPQRPRDPTEGSSRVPSGMRRVERAASSRRHSAKALSGAFRLAGLPSQTRPPQSLKLCACTAAPLASLPSASTEHGPHVTPHRTRESQRARSESREQPHPAPAQPKWSCIERQSTKLARSRSTRLTTSTLLSNARSCASPNATSSSSPTPFCSCASSREPHSPHWLPLSR